jgi:hypothetical protein
MLRFSDDPPALTHYSHPAKAESGIDTPDAEQAT